MLETTQCIGKYVLQEPLGHGGSSYVWKAFDPLLHRYVAVKFLQSSLRADIEHVHQFHNEARAIASLHHPNIIQVFDIASAPFAEDGVVEADVAYMVMRYVKGETLADYITRTSRSGNFPDAQEMIHLLTALGSAVDYAHSHGVLHRDIKPANILLDCADRDLIPIGRPILTDFGLVKTNFSDDLTPNEQSVIIGTPVYIAPELAQGMPATRQSDLYALGVVAYELCTGKFPHDFPDQPTGRHPISVVLQHALFDPIPPSHFNPNASSLLDEVLLRAIAREPEQRYENAEAFTCDLARALGYPLEPPFEQDVLTPSATSSSYVNTEKDTTESHEFHLPFVDRTEQKRRGAAKLHPLFHHVPIGGTWWKREKRTPAMMLCFALASLLLFTVLFAQVAQSSTRLPRQALMPTFIVGKVDFANSESGVTTDDQGVNDRVVVQLVHVAPPKAGKSYYAWLQGDTDRSDAPVILLGRLTVDAQGSAHLADVGGAYVDPQHSNLLTTMSRLLITEEDSQVPPAFPSPDKVDWRFSGSISQQPSETDSSHFSLLDHLRHLLASDPKLDALGLHGGLSLWLYRNAGVVERFAQGAKARFDAGDAQGSLLELVRILEYLDGIKDVGRDVPVGTPIVVNHTFAQVGLLQTHANQDPPAYLYHVGLHLNGLITSPGVTLAQQQLAARIVEDLDLVRTLLDQVRTIAQNLVTLSPTQLTALPGVEVQLASLVHVATEAYGGQPGTFQGVTGIHQQMEFLTMMQVTTYVGS